MDVYLETERLRLRALTADDLDNLAELDSDPEVMRYLSGGVPTSREQIRDRVLPRVLGFYDRYPSFGVWAAEDPAGAFLGWFVLRPSETPDFTGHEIGYRLRRSAWGRGLATEGTLALLRRAFTELGVERVYAQTMAVNAPSRRVMEKAGLRYVRTFFQEWPEEFPGSEQGDVEYAVTRAEWLAQA